MVRASPVFGVGCGLWYRMRNHYVPQFLQRPWTSPEDGALQVFHMTASGVHCTRKVPKSTGYRDDMLALTRDEIAGMRKHDVETIVLQQVDNDAALVRSRLYDHQLNTLTHDERCAWVRFLMSLRIRDPAVVRDLKADADKVLRKSLADNPHEYVQLLADDDPATLEEWTEHRFPGLIENFGLSFFHELLNDDRIGNALLHLKWWVFDVSSAKNDLLLGDRPAIFFGDIDGPNFAAALPLAPHRLFLATRGTTLATGLPKVPSSSLVAQVNDATVRQAETYVYGIDTGSLRFVQNRRS